jgi:putative FmdB family regulatory protein
MPIYEYRCKKGHHFDVMQRIGEDPVTKCEVCGATVSRVFHPPSLHFKGSGFYNTDYGTRKRAREKESGGGGEGKEAASANSSSGDSGKSDSKSDSKSDGNSSSGSDSGAKKSSEKAKASTSS